MIEGDSLWQLVERRAQATRERVMLVDESHRELRFGELRDRAEHAAAGFAGLGVTVGSCVAWQLPTWIESYVLVNPLPRNPDGKVLKHALRKQYGDA